MILIVVTAGMVSTTWVQFIKGSLLVVFCIDPDGDDPAAAVSTVDGGASEPPFADKPAADVLGGRNDACETGGGQASRTCDVQDRATGASTVGAGDGRGRRRS